MKHSYEEPGSPAPLPWTEYAPLVKVAYQGLLNQSPSQEKVFQRFIEQHPSLLEQEEKRHDGWPSVVVTQPLLQTYTKRTPDFMLIEEDSGKFQAVFVEIETPEKRYVKAGNKPTMEFIAAVEQVNEWRRWFTDPRHEDLFRDHHDLWFREDFSRRYVLIYGRSSQEPPGFEAMRRDYERPDFQIMSFDRLVPHANQENFVCVKRVVETPSDHRILELVGLPACFTFDILSPGLCARVRSSEGAIRGAAFMPSGRAEYILKRWEEVAEEGRLQYKRPRRRPPPT